MKNLFLLLTFIACNLTVFSQSTIFKERVVIKGQDVFYNNKNSRGDTIIPKIGAIRTYKKEYTNDDITYVITVKDTIKVTDTLAISTTNKVTNITKIDTVLIPDTIFGTKDIKRKFQPLHNKPFGSVTPDADDPSILHVNYWLDHQNIIPKGVKAKIYTGTWIGDKLDFKVRDTIYNTSDTVRLTRANPKSVTDQYLNTVTYKIAIFKKDKPNEIDYWLLNAYDSDRDYSITLGNRNYVSFNYRAFEMGALTIPFKYRPEYTSGLGTEFSADFNIGTYIGCSWGRVKYFNRKKEEVAPTKIQFTAGGFFTVSRIEVDDTTALGAISPGIAGMVSIYGFKVGLFVGSDIAIGDKAGKFRHNYYPWFGFGIGYNIGLLWDK